jgi:hypothetical protein
MTKMTGHGSINFRGFFSFSRGLDTAKGVWRHWTYFFLSKNPHPVSVAFTLCLLLFFYFFVIFFELFSGLEK